MTLFVMVAGCIKSADTDAPEDSDKGVVTIGIVPYPQIEVLAAIFETANQELGYSTERVEGDMGFMWLGVSQGDIDIFPDGWLPVTHANYVEKYKDKLEVGEVLYENAALGIAVPTYMEDINTIQDLKDNADLFNNRIVGIEPSAGMMFTTAETIEAYDMADKVEILESSTAGMLAELDKAIKTKKPIAFLAWRAHTMFSNYDIKLLEDDKGIWSADDVHVITGLDLKEKAPKVYEFAQRFEITIDVIEDVLAESEETGASISEVTKAWFAENREALDYVLAQK